MEDGKWDKGKRGGKKRGSTYLDFSRQRNEGHGRRGVGGCRSGNVASSICHLSFSLSSCDLSSLPFPSFHASVLLFLASRGSVSEGK